MLGICLDIVEAREIMHNNYETVSHKYRCWNRQQLCRLPLPGACLGCGRLGAAQAGKAAAFTGIVSVLCGFVWGKTGPFCTLCKPVTGAQRASASRAALSVLLNPALGGSAHPALAAVPSEQGPIIPPPPSPAPSAFSCRFPRTGVS